MNELFPIAVIASLALFGLLLRRFVRARREAKHLSPCCGAVIDASLADGVLLGSCSKCGKSVTRQRLDGRSGAEWLDGNSPWFNGKLREMR